MVRSLYREPTHVFVRNEFCGDLNLSLHKLAQLLQHITRTLAEISGGDSPDGECEDDFLVQS